jgi:hypothetical protein
MLTLVLSQVIFVATDESEKHFLIVSIEQA